MNPTVPEIMLAAAKTYEERNKAYGDNYKKFGAMMVALYPNGIKVETADDWNRLGVFIQIASKFSRYAETFQPSSFAAPVRAHIDTAHDMAVYSAMLEEVSRSAADALKVVSPSETLSAQLERARSGVGAPELPDDVREAARVLAARLDGRESLSGPALAQVRALLARIGS